MKNMFERVIDCQILAMIESFPMYPGHLMLYSQVNEYSKQKEEVCQTQKWSKSTCKKVGDCPKNASSI